MPKKLSWDSIRSKAEEFRLKYVKPFDIIPVPIFEIVEFDLNIEPRPINGLLEKIDIDGFLSKDLKKIFIDNNIYSNPKYENRLRFTIAHEIGHLILHKEEIEKSAFRTEADWVNFREEFSEDDLYLFEQQAYEFAGRLLVPKQKLISELERNKEKIKKFKKIYNNAEEMLLSAISRVICDKFGVSDQVILRRVKNEKIWNEIKL